MSAQNLCQLQASTPDNIENNIIPEAKRLQVTRKTLSSVKCCATEHRVRWPLTKRYQTKQSKVRR